jgi:hypothetical protein
MRLIGVWLSGLTGAVQQSLFDEPITSSTAAARAVAGR